MEVKFRIKSPNHQRPHHRNGNERRKSLKWDYLEEERCHNLCRDGKKGRDYANVSFCGVDRHIKKGERLTLPKHKSESVIYNKNCQNIKKTTRKEDNFHDSKPRKHRWNLPSDDSDDYSDRYEVRSLRRPSHSENTSSKSRRRSETGSRRSSVSGDNKNSLAIKSKTSISERKAEFGRSRTEGSRFRKGGKSTTTISEVARNARTITHKETPRCSPIRRKDFDMTKQLNIFNKGKPLETVSHVIRRGNVVVVQKRCEELHNETIDDVIDSDLDIVTGTTSAGSKSKRHMWTPDQSHEYDTKSKSYDPTSSLTTQSHRLYQSKIHPLTPKSNTETFHKNSSSRESKRSRRRSLFESSPRKKDAKPDESLTNSDNVSYNNPSIADKESTTRLEKNFKGYGTSENLLNGMKSDSEGTSGASDNINTKIVPIKSHNMNIKQLAKDYGCGKSRSKKRTRTSPKSLTELPSLNGSKTFDKSFSEMKSNRRVSRRTTDITIPGFSDDDDSTILKSMVTITSSSKFHSDLTQNILSPLEQSSNKPDKKKRNDFLMTPPQKSELNKLDSVDEKYTETALEEYFKERENKRIPNVPNNSFCESDMTASVLKSYKQAIGQLHDSRKALTQSHIVDPPTNIGNGINEVVQCTTANCISSDENGQKVTSKTEDLIETTIPSSSPIVTEVRRSKTGHSNLKRETSNPVKSLTLPAIELNSIGLSSNKNPQKDLKTENVPPKCKSFSNSERKMSFKSLVNNKTFKSKYLQRRNTISNCFGCRRKSSDIFNHKELKSRSLTCIMSSFKSVRAKTTSLRKSFNSKLCRTVSAIPSEKQNDKSTTKSPVVPGLLPSKSTVSSILSPFALGVGVEDLCHLNTEESYLSLPIIPSTYADKEKTTVKMSEVDSSKAGLNESNSCSVAKEHTPLSVVVDANTPDIHPKSDENIADNSSLRRNFKSQSEGASVSITFNEAMNRDDLRIDGQSVADVEMNDPPIQPRCSCWQYDKSEPWYSAAGKGIGWKIILSPAFLIIGPVAWVFKMLHLNTQIAACCRECWFVDSNEYWFSCKGKGRGWVCLLIPMYIILGPLIFIFTLITVILLSCCGGTNKKRSNKETMVPGPQHNRLRRPTMTQPLSTSSGRYSRRPQTNMMRH